MGTEERSPEDVFGVVANETRIDVIEAFVERRRELFLEEGIPTVECMDVTMGFSELMNAVGLRDSGRFNYHLNELLDSFVAETDDGEYRLTWAGEEIAGSILAGTYGDVEIEPEPIDADCPLCDAAVEAGYRKGIVAVSCANDHFLLATGVPSGAVEDRTMDELLALAATQQWHEMELVVDGVCPMCYGRSTVTVGPVDHTEDMGHGIEGVCGRCGNFFVGTVGGSVVRHPAVVGFYDEHGVDVRELYPWEVGFVRGEEAITVVAEDPYRYEIAVELDGDVLTLTVDEDGEVVDRERS